MRSGIRATMKIYGDWLSFGQVMLMAAYLALMTVVCLLACFVPPGRALGIPATEALRTEGLRPA